MNDDKQDVYLIDVINRLINVCGHVKSELSVEQDISKEAEKVLIDNFEDLLA